MSEVRMSLKEYNELKEKLDRQERILRAITTPAPIPEWDIKYHQEHPGHYFYMSTSPLDNLICEDKAFLQSMIYQNASVLAEEQFVSRDMALMFEMNLEVRLGYFKDIEEPKCEEAEAV